MNIKKDVRLLKDLVFLIILLYLWLVWIHSVYAGKLDFNIFSKGGYKQVLFATIVAMIYMVIRNYYDKRKQKRTTKKNKE